MSRSAGPVRSGGRRVLLILGVGLLLAGLAPRVESAPPPTTARQPHIGYVYPAGGQIGKTVEITVGGMFLRQIEAFHISGEGVKGTVRFWAPPPRNLIGDERRTVMDALRAAVQRKVGVPTGRRAGRARPPVDPNAPPAEMPDHPMLKDLETKSLEDLEEIRRYFFVRVNPLQRKRAIEELVKVRVTIAPDAEPGVRELRLITKAGATNPIPFHVGVLPELKERPPFAANLPGTPATDVPVVLNGQVHPRNLDRFPLRLKRGQNLVFRADARSLVPFQADSVPGWMQTTLTLRDADGNEVAYADEYRFDPDPTLFYSVPETGEYVLEVADAISRGRADFVYRVMVGELPHVTRIFPLGGRRGTLVQATVEGWNLGWERIPLDTRGEGNGIREGHWRSGDAVTNAVPYEVDELPEIIEVERGNDDPETAPRVELPVIVNGRIDHLDDVDVVTFKGRSRDEVVVEVCARRLGSPLDSTIRLVGPRGEVVAWNDDYVPEGLQLRAFGLQTHHADSYFRAKLPRNGTYQVRISDVRSHGSPSHAYRLRISAPRPDVELYVVPSNINLQAGRTALVAVHALRKDGFDGAIDIQLKDAPEGFILGGNTMPSTRDVIWMTMTAPGGTTGPLPLQFVGRTKIGREAVERVAAPADDVMQAFLWRHLVPAAELLVSVGGRGGFVPIVQMEDEEPVKVPRGGKGIAEFTATRRLPLNEIILVILDPPKGVSLGKIKPTSRGFDLEIKASRDAVRTGQTDSLIIEAFVEREVTGRDGKTKTKRRFSLGYLPAVPYVVRRR